MLHTIVDIIDTYMNMFISSNFWIFSFMIFFFTHSLKIVDSNLIYFTTWYHKTLDENQIDQGFQRDSKKIKKLYFSRILGECIEAIYNALN